MEIWVAAIYLPIAGALVGLATKWAAIKLMFHPAEFVGVGKIGWHGIVQRRSPKFAGGVADSVMGEDLTVDALVGRIDLDELGALAEPAIEARADHLAGLLLDAAKPGASDDDAARAAVAGVLPDRGRRLVADVVGELAEPMGRHLDIRSLVVDMLSGKNADRLARLTQHVAGAELRWVIWYGGILGFAIGALGIGGYVAFERWWMLPVIGVVDGLVNNYLAIQMIFRPLERKRYLGVFAYQGLFAARQHEISASYGSMLADEVLTPANLVERLGQDSGALLPEVLPVFEAALAPLSADVAAAAGVADDAGLRQRLLLALMPEMGSVLEPARAEMEQLAAKQLDIARTIEHTLSSMPKEEFEHVLRGIFEEDETTLIAMGGVLGGGIGCLQAALVVALGLA